MSTFWIVLLGSFLGVLLALVFILAAWLVVVAVALGDPKPRHEAGE